MLLFSFERLDVWRLSRELCGQIYQISSHFSSDERYGITSQVRRAAVSVTCNLAEGSSRHTPGDKARFTEMAYGSLMEVLNLLEIAADIQLLPRETLDAVRPKIEEIANKLNRLRESQLSGK